MKRRNFIQLFYSLVIAVVIPLSAYAKVGSGTPNIVVILADDMGYGDAGCYDANSKIPTPHLDKMAREGMRFTDAHTPSAVCSPTRYGLLTGRYAWRTEMKKGVLGAWDRPLIEKNRLKYINPSFLSVLLSEQPQFSKINIRRVRNCSALSILFLSIVV